MNGFLARYAWAGAIGAVIAVIGAVLGFAVGQYWQYVWAGPAMGAVIAVIGAVLGFVIGQYWQYAEFGLKQRAVTIQEVLAQKELYARLQVLQNHTSDAIPRYLVQRDRYFAPPSEADQYEVQNTYQAEKGKLVGLIREYNRLEVKLSAMERREPRFLVLPIPPLAPRNLRIEEAGPGGVAGAEARLVWDHPGPDPVRVEVEKDLKELYRQYGWEYPKRSTISKNR